MRSSGTKLEAAILAKVGGARAFSAGSGSRVPIRGARLPHCLCGQKASAGTLPRVLRHSDRSIIFWTVAAARTKTLVAYADVLLGVLAAWLGRHFGERETLICLPRVFVADRMKITLRLRLFSRCFLSFVYFSPGK